MTQVIGKKVRLMNVPLATEQEQVQQLVITPQGRVRKKEQEAVSFLFLFMVGDFNTDSHYHTLGITTAEFQYLASSFRNNITKQTSEDEGHSHEVTFAFNPATNSFDVLSIISAGDFQHLPKLISINTPNQPTGFTGTVGLNDTQGTSLYFENGILEDVTSIQQPPVDGN